MSVSTTSSGLRVKDSPFEPPWLIADEERLDDCVQFMNGTQFSDFMGILVSRDLGFPRMDLSFLNRTPGLHGLWVSDNVADGTPLTSLAYLRVLRLAENRFPVDLSAFPELREAGFDWNDQIVGLSSCAKLEKLTIGSFNPKTRDLSLLPPLAALHDLSIVHSNIQSVDSIDRFPHIERLSLSYCPKLERMDSLPESLAELELDGCKRLTDHSTVSRLPRLRKLILSKAGKIPDLSFISELKTLESLSFVGSPVQDGNMAPLLQHPHLMTVGFDDKRHYSMTCAKVQEQLKDKRTTH